MRKNNGFVTLVELLVIIGLVGTLIALLLPAISAARQATTQAAKEKQEEVKQEEVKVKIYTVKVMKPDGTIHKTFTVQTERGLFTTFKDGGMILCKKTKWEPEPLLAVASGWMIDFQENAENE